MRSSCTSSRASVTKPLRRNLKLVRPALLAAVALGCSATSNDGSSQGDGGPGFMWHGSGGNGGQLPVSPTCNDGIVQQQNGEQCDGPVNQTCSTATMNSLPYGTVTCTNCRIDTSGCSSNGPGTGGGVGTGGGIGAGGGNGAGNTNGGGGTANTGGDTPTQLPQPKGTCAPFVTGDMTFNGQRFKVWAGAPAHGPLVIYWYATYSSVAEVTSGLGQAAINDITSQGGVVAAMYATSKTGSDTGDAVWFTGDFDFADEVVACAIQEQHIDTRRIHALGFSAGGLETGYMAYARSNYMASVVTYSGGSFTTALQDPSNVPAVMCQHGTQGQDKVVIDFSDFSHTLEDSIKGLGGFAMDCDHGGGHMIPAADVPSSWRFLSDHPYKVNPEPYAGGIPSGFPSYCVIR
jgi:predicted esterase